MSGLAEPYVVPKKSLKKCDVRALSWTLSQFQVIDFTGDYWQACEALLRVWNKRLQPSVRRKLDR